MKKETGFPKWSEVKPATATDVLEAKKRTPYDAPFVVLSIVVRFGLPITCWCLPFVSAYFLDIPWWQGATVGYFGSAALMTSYLLLFQSTMGSCSCKALDLGLSWPITTFVMKDPIGLSIDLGMI